MRKLFVPAALLVVAALFFLPAPPALAADFPALGDGGSLVFPADAGFYHCATPANSNYTKNGWKAVVRCTPYGPHYVFCADATCVPTMHNQYLAPDLTYDIEVPGNLNTLCIKTFDGGVPVCTLNYRRDRGE